MREQTTGHATIQGDGDLCGLQRARCAELADGDLRAGENIDRRAIVVAADFHPTIWLSKNAIAQVLVWLRAVVANQDHITR